MSYLGRSAKLSLKAQEKVSFLATAGQTSKTGLSYVPSFVEVYVNGVLLTDTTDFTATNGNSITFTVALLLNDEVTVVSLKTFTVADHYTKSDADTLLAAKATNTALALKAPIASPSFTGKVGIGSSSPVRQLEIKDDGTLGQAIVGIIADAGDPAGIFMGTTSNNNAGGIRYFTDTNKLTLRANDEDRLLIDSAGIVTKPYQPSFRVGSVTYVSSGTTILHTIDFHDIGNNYNPANGRFTAPVAGVYYFGAQAISGSASTSSEQNLRFMKNSTAVCDARARSYVESSLHLKTVIELAAGDYIYVVVDAGSVYASSNGFHNQFMGYLIG
jgi:hypothetical protein